MRRTFLKMTIFAVMFAGLAGVGHAASADDQANLLKVRESVWRAWFANDTAAMKRLIPAETIAISAGDEEWKHQAEIFKEAAEFQAQGGKLVRLEFPRNEVQRFGDVAIIYTQYELETEVGGKRSVSAGRATEIFVRRNGEWTNPGWHTDSAK